MTAMGSLFSCRYNRSPATHARLREPGSWPRLPACDVRACDRSIQDIEDALQGARVDACADPHQPTIPKLYLNAIISPRRFS
jgi:hypothetical protein